MIIFNNRGDIMSKTLRVPKILLDVKPVGELNKKPVYKQNPFLSETCIRIKNRNQMLAAKELYDDEGNIYDGAVCQVRAVDDEKFIKLFTVNMKAFFDLKSPGVKTLGIVFYAVQKWCLASDRVTLPWAVAKELAKEIGIKIGQSTFSKGIKELIDLGFIAQTTSQGVYFININLIFNGNRYTFINTIVRKDSPEGQRIEQEIEKLPPAFRDEE